MSDPDASLDVLVGQVARAGGAGDPRYDYVVFGSAVLWLHGIRAEIGDVDAFVKVPVWNVLLDNGWTLVDPVPGIDPPFLELDLSPHPPLHAFYDWTRRDGWLNVSRCYNLAEGVRGVRCIPLVEVARHKREAYRDYPDSSEHTKHLSDLRALERLGYA